MTDGRTGISFSKRIIALVFLLNILFTGIILYIVYTGGQEPPALVGAFFAFTTGELWFLSTIKKKEIEAEAEEVQEDEGEEV